MNGLYRLALLSVLGVCMAQAVELPKFLRGENNRQLQNLLPSPVAIATLVTGLTDLTELGHSLETLVHAKRYPSSEYVQAPVIMFYDTNSANLGQGQTSAFAAAISDQQRELILVPVSFGNQEDFPAGFILNPSKDYTYEQSQRFLISQMWKHEALNGYETIMRISDDSCLSIDSPTLPNVVSALDVSGEILFQCPAVPYAYEIARKYSLGLYDFALNYISNTIVTSGNAVLNPAMFAQVTKVFAEYRTVPVLNNHFEVVKMSFITRPDVAAWLDHMTESAPYNVHLNTWGSNEERFITVALFATPSEISLVPVPGLMEKDFIAGRTNKSLCRATTATN
uniref:Hexosyltransferase n=1 Tax=Eucampia antarctica TaxID=49252 RepID=A0A7S2RCF9_9STRA|mmetsp:Transcript_20181/g.19427  ORF Transcript_20181/g.19427 Transcript_20181/m.19427 type:complete len:339 (+) Transcript_20181:75-1091(+)|eukprot:CAMPEP_0197831290 /NCGR_PEP_ID=MMETSP1437-20131217/8964_1 /TAXON_ID=49252 ORGANISM="Eucampia antarctica, Strain CCMP1452" /NCGR_SAMPLE_ID=MMETSP1437 /ASSEMBLY_ACC=CAM_ASM_001096 /LENGTH=338 /DNA_ID=CAMNT_0043434145 /DNA_START=71 /DNA_END=1087 /DNA_ORIENTATION=+